jgi:hypothetical protein
MASWREQSGKAFYQWLGEPQFSVVRLLVFVPAIVAVVEIWRWMAQPPNNVWRLFLFWLAIVVAGSSLNRRPVAFAIRAVIGCALCLSLVIVCELIRRNL